MIRNPYYFFDDRPIPVYKAYYASLEVYFTCRGVNILESDLEKPTKTLGGKFVVEKFLCKGR